MANDKKDNGDRPQSIRFHYIKSNHFRVVHIDGAIGSRTPSGFLHIAMYSERPAIPREQEFPINKDGTLGEVGETISRDGVVRELEVDTIMSFDVAKNLRDWLTKHITEAEKNISQGVDK